MNTMGITTSTPRPRASWFQSACAGVLGVGFGFLLGTATLSSTPREAVKPRLAQTAPPVFALPQTPAGKAAAAFAAAMPPPPGEGQARPAMIEFSGLQPCWAEIHEPVHC